jgi:hypothetical protein
MPPIARRRSLIPYHVVLFTLAFTFLSSTKVLDARLHDIEEEDRNEIVVSKIEPIDDDHARRLLTCRDYQYRVTIRDNLYMYYVANADSATMSMKLEYFGLAWISLGINEQLEGAMIGSEAWMAFPDSPVSKSNPGVYAMTTETAAGVILSPSQMLFDATIEQGDGITSTSFTRKYEDFFQINQSINATGPNEFVWAYGFSNVYTIHEGTGHFTLTVEECTIPKDTIQDIDKKKRRKCGLFRLSIFCPFTLCGVFGRFIGLC